jgi:aspartyl-tRNA(Asn)/glutamyl-tRNA(Gln) amidotransferase subunit A
MIEPASVRSVRDAFAGGQRTAVDICQAALAAIARANGALNAFTTVAAEQALARAAALDRDRAQWAGAPLAAVPIAVKDNICTSGVRTTASSRMLEHYVPPYDATAVSRLEAAGAVLVGKTNCDEFAMGSSNERSAFGPVRNPWAHDRVPGGTSGGSAAAVAARLVPAALGSDTGGSVRQPSALCGVVGLKPTYGRVSRYGLIAHASSLDQIGPIAASAADAAAMLAAMAGADPCDATASDAPVPDYAAALTGDIRGLRLGVPRALVGEGVDADVTRAFFAALDVLAARGARLIDVDLPYAEHAVPVYYLVSTAEASSNLARYDGVRYGHRAAAAGAPRDVRAMYTRTRAEGFGSEVKRRIMLGTYVLSAGYYDAYYLKAQQVRTLIAQGYDAAFARVDAVAVPTSPTPAFRLGERVSDPLQMYLADVFTVSANLTGLPAISVPCGFTRHGLPIGLQLTAGRFEEATLLCAADAFERDTDWSRQAPPDAASPAAARS